MNYYLAIDIGASSGRHILCHLENGKLVLEEIYRFKNGYIEKNGKLCWDIGNLKDSVINGIKKCKEIGKIPVSVGIDTWAVDFVLLDGEKDIIGDAVSYRDSRTGGMDEITEKVISFEELYSITGIQKQIFNTIYQLTALNKESPNQMAAAEYFLMIPDYLNYILTGKAANEYTNASSTALVNAKNKTWDMELIRKLGFKESLFGKLMLAGETLGGFSDEIRKIVGFNCNVVLPATHDTGSAFLSIPAKNDNSVYISSGTWSLIGVENKEPITSKESMEANFTNEGGYNYRYRYLKNIMGLWMIQSIKKELNDEYSFAELEQMAKDCAHYSCIVDVSDDRFLAPKSMISEVKAACMELSGSQPETIGEIMQCVYLSLSRSYKNAIDELSRLTGKSYTAVNIVGGGSKDRYLNMLTARETGLPVYAGPTEGTALGNLMVQMIASGEFADLNQAREAVRNSFDIKEYKI